MFHANTHGVFDVVVPLDIDIKEFPAFTAIVDMDTEGFLMLGMTYRSQGARLLLDTDTWHRAAELTAEYGDLVVPPRPHRTLFEGLAALRDLPEDTTLMIPHAVLHNHVRAGTRKVCTHIDLVTGYPVPPSVVARGVLAELIGRLRDEQRRALARVVVQDPSGMFEKTFGAMPVWLATDQTAAASEPALIPESPEHEEINPGVVLEHARFLTGTGIDELRAMLRFESMRDLWPVYDHWLAVFQDCAREMEDPAPLVEAALVVARLAGVPLDAQTLAQQG